MYTLWFIVVCACTGSLAQEGPRVKTEQGVVIGNVVDGHLAFYGIPYAGLSSGQNRFKAPTPAPSFPGDYHAIDNNIFCAQPSPRGIIGIEDCLTLNVYTKNTTTPKPVIVFIYGENFATYSQHISVNTLVQADLVVVTINYRLSIFGFLCLGVNDAPGNAGLKDVIQGLKWIQSNIAGFGGDSNNVVLLGHGSGATMVDLITLSPLAEGLVHKALALSGSGLAPWAISYDPVNQAKSIGDRIGYAGKDREELAKLLVTTDFSILGNVIDGSAFPNNTISFGPCVENSKLNPNDTFLADAPINILRSGNFIDIPYIGGNVDKEGSIKASYAALNQWLEKMEANFGEFIQVDLSFESERNQSAIVSQIREFYFSQRQINMETIENFLDYHGDTSYMVPVTRNVRERALKSKSEVRLFEFAYRGTLNSDWPFPQIPVNGAKHGAILNFLFDYDLKPADSHVRNNLVKRVTAFAYTGNPDPKNENFTTWLPIQGSLSHVLYISGEEVAPNVTIFNEELKFNLNQQEMEFWNNLYSKYYLPPKPVSAASKLTFLSCVVLVSQIVLRLV